MNQLNQLTVVVNGDRLIVAPGSTVADVVALLTDGAEAKGIAVAVDRAVVPRSEWPSTLVRAGSQVEVVTAAAGG